MPGFVFLNRKVELLGVKIIFLRNVLPVLNFSKDETFLKENWSNRQRKKYTVNTIPFQIYSIFFFFALYKLTWDVASSFPFSLKGERKRFLFYNHSFFVISPIKSIPFLKFSRDHLRSTLGITCGRGSFAVHSGDHLRSRDHLRLGIICGTVQYCRCLFGHILSIFQQNDYGKTIWVLKTCHVHQKMVIYPLNVEWVNRWIHSADLSLRCRDAHHLSFVSHVPLMFLYK